MQRKTLIALLTVLVTATLLPLGCGNDEDERSVVLFTFVRHPVLDEVRDSIEEELRANGVSDIREVSVSGDKTKIPGAARDILAATPSVVVPIATPPTAGLIGVDVEGPPVVFSFVTEPRVLGLENSKLSVTGVSNTISYRAALEIIRAFIPDAKKVGTIFNPKEANSKFALEELRTHAKQLGLLLLEQPVQTTGAVVDAVRAFPTDVDAILIPGDNTAVAGAAAIVETAAERGLPVFASDDKSVTVAGACAAPSIDYSALGRETARLTLRVLSGEDPKSIPVVRFRSSGVIVNEEALASNQLTVPDGLKGQLVGR